MRENGRTRLSKPPASSPAAETFTPIVSRMKLHFLIAGLLPTARPTRGALIHQSIYTRTKLVSITKQKSILFIVNVV